MYVQVVTYSLAGIDEGEYFDVAHQLTARFAAMPGLLAKLWLGNTDEERYGAVYLWEDREAMERFLASDVFEGTNPDFSELAAEDFDVLENLTVATQPVLEVVEPRRRPTPKAKREPSRGAVSTGARQIPGRTGAAKGTKKATTAKGAVKKTAKAVKKTARRSS